MSFYQETKDFPKFLKDSNLDWTLEKGIVSIPETAANTGAVKKQAHFVSIDQMNNVLNTLTSS